MEIFGKEDFGFCGPYSVTIMFAFRFFIPLFTVFIVVEAFAVEASYKFIAKIEAVLYAGSAP